jgi:hypothetical protein
MFNFDKKINNILGKSKSNSFNMPKIDFFSKDTTPLKDAKFLTLYHGTTQSNANNILQHGLKPQVFKTFDNKSKKISFVTPNVSTAINYINRRKYPSDVSGQVEYYPGTLLQVKVPVSIIKKDSPESHKLIKTKTQSYFNEIELKHTVPPENIKKIDVNEAKNKALRQMYKPQNFGNYREEYRNEVKSKSPYDLYIEQKKIKEGLETLEQPTEDKDMKFNYPIKSRYPNRPGYKIVWKNIDEVIEKHKKTDPENDITNPKNEIGNRYPNAIEFIKNEKFLEDTGWEEKLGFEPPLISKRGSIMDGRHRLKALKTLGYTEIPIEEYDPEDDKLEQPTEDKDMSVLGKKIDKHTPFMHLHSDYINKYYNALNKFKQPETRQQFLDLHKEKDDNSDEKIQTTDDERNDIINEFGQVLDEMSSEESQERIKTEMDFLKNTKAKERRELLKNEMEVMKQFTMPQKIKISEIQQRNLHKIPIDLLKEYQPIVYKFSQTPEEEKYENKLISEEEKFKNIVESRRRLKDIFKKNILNPKQDIESKDNKIRDVLESKGIEIKGEPAEQHAMLKQMQENPNILQKVIDKPNIKNIKTNILNEEKDKNTQFDNLAYKTKPNIEYPLYTFTGEQERKKDLSDIDDLKRLELLQDYQQTLENRENNTLDKSQRYYEDKTAVKYMTKILKGQKNEEKYINYFTPRDILLYRLRNRKALKSVKNIPAEDFHVLGKQQVQKKYLYPNKLKDENLSKEDIKKLNLLYSSHHIFIQDDKDIENYIQTPNWKLYKIPQRKLTDEVINKYMQQSDSRLYNIPLHKITDEILNKYMQQSDWYIDDIPQEKVTDEVVNKYIQRADWKLYRIPRNKITDEVINKYMQKSVWDIHDIPKEKRTDEIVNKYMQQADWYISHIPEKKITDEVVNKYMQRADWKLHNIPQHKITDEIVNKYMQQPNWNIKQIPEEKLTDEIVNKYMQKSDWDIREIPKEKLTDEIINKYTQQSDWDIWQIPKEKLTDEIVNKQRENAFNNVFGVKQKALIQNLPKNIDMANLALYMIRHNKKELRYEDVANTNFARNNMNIKMFFNSKRNRINMDDIYNYDKSTIGDEYNTEIYKKKWGFGYDGNVPQYTQVLTTPVTPFLSKMVDNSKFNKNLHGYINYSGHPRTFKQETLPLSWIRAVPSSQETIRTKGKHKQRDDTVHIIEMQSDLDQIGLPQGAMAKYQKRNLQEFLNIIKNETPFKRITINPYDRRGLKFAPGIYVEMPSKLGFKQNKDEMEIDLSKDKRINKKEIYKYKTINQNENHKI